MNEPSLEQIREIARALRAVAAAHNDPDLAFGQRAEAIAVALSGIEDLVEPGEYGESRLARIQEAATRALADWLLEHPEVLGERVQPPDGKVFLYAGREVRPFPESYAGNPAWQPVAVYRIEPEERADD